MTKNPHDPLARTDLSGNERRMLRFTLELLHGDNESLIDEYVAEDYIQHTHGIGQGREGFRRYIKEIAWQRPRRHDVTVLHLFAVDDFVILHKLLPTVVVVDIMRCNDDHQFVEHWDVVQRLPDENYDPMALSTENFDRFRKLFW